jgi:hypothetical protein
LKSNNWSLYRPSYVLAEALDTSLDLAMEGEMVGFMRNQGYKIFAKTFNTLIFCESSK